MNKSLVIQEQNTIPGMTNRWLAKMACKVFEAFPGSFEHSVNATVSGNPVRRELFALQDPQLRICTHDENPHLLVLGGSLGAQALNEALPTALAMIDNDKRPVVKHQAGRDKAMATTAAYKLAEVNADVLEFIEDMAAAYEWADIVICRSGALTVSELAAVGVASVLVPYPYAVDDHQTHNAQYLVEAGAAELMPQESITPSILADKLSQLIADPQRLKRMANAAQELAQPHSAQMIAAACEELLA
jgi:UDP-N-acetylglucosamine--N-acetylmuramyl-(pentapeptide) pyrophosphoryl-undecaprenol N-acetylglucosamine transferase